MVFGGLKIDENVVGAYLFDGFGGGGFTFWYLRKVYFSAVLLLDSQP